MKLRCEWSYRGIELSRVRLLWIYGRNPWKSILVRVIGNHRKLTVHFQGHENIPSSGRLGREALASAKRWKRCSLRQSEVTHTKRWRRCDQCQRSEKIYPALSAGNYVTSAMGGKRCNQRQTREIYPPSCSRKKDPGKTNTKSWWGHSSSECSHANEPASLPPLSRLVATLPNKFNSCAYEEWIMINAFAVEGYACCFQLQVQT